LGTGLERRQGPVEVEEQGDVVEAGEGTRRRERFDGARRRAGHASVVFLVRGRAQQRVITATLGSDLRPGTAMTRSPACWNSRFASAEPTLRFSILMLSMPIGRRGWSTVISL